MYISAMLANKTGYGDGSYQCAACDQIIKPEERIFSIESTMIYHNHCLMRKLRSVKFTMKYEPTTVLQ